MLNNNRNFFWLGFIAPIPLFLVPYFPFIHLNIIIQDPNWIQLGFPPYSGYTSSLGMAAPLVLFSAFSSFILFLFSNNKTFDKKFIHASILVVLFSFITLYLSNSIKVLGPISSFIGFMMVCFIFRSKYWKSYSFGFLFGISLFCVAHASSFLLYGVEFSKNSEGISIFNFEIYQSLVAYAALISFFFGTLLLNNRIFSVFPFFKDNLLLERLVYLLVISSTLMILAMTSRRLSIIVCLIACFFLFAKFLVNGNYFKILKMIASLLVILTVCYYFIGDFFSGNKSFNYTNMIQPRLDAYLEKLYFISDVSTNKLLFGSIDGWAQIENGILDIILSTGLIGLLAFTIIFVYATVLLFQIALLEIIWSKNIILYIVYSFIVLFLNNLVNNGISTPYFFISFLILFTMSVKFLSHRELKNE
tara:strand:+ start:102 stop:1355 length:1254 start_codon:yes stop_codon:yes gene_type:complete